MRSLSWGDPDYPDNVLAVLTDIVRLNAESLDEMEQFVGASASAPVSTSAGKGVAVMFRPGVFDVPSEPVDHNLVALMMPFDAAFAGVHQAIVGACSDAGLRCLRVDDIWNHSTVIQDVFSLIWQSAIVVCDFTGRNANVFYEAGIAHTLGKEVVPITQNAADVPFDLSHHRYLGYLANAQGLADLRTALAARLQTLRAQIAGR